MSRFASLRARLILSHLLLVIVVALTGLLSVRLLTPVFFESGLQRRGGTVLGAGEPAGRGGAGGSSLAVTAEVQDTYNEALTQAVLIAGSAGLVAALILGALFSRRVLRRLSEVRHAAQHLAGGDYAHSIAIPPEPELADLATSINTLGSTLAATEENRARLMSDVAHELRNPLTTIEGYMEALIDGVLPPTVETYSEVAAEAQRLKRLTEDLSFVSRAQEGSVRYEMVPADLADLAAAAAQRFRPVCEQAGVVLELDLDVPAPVMADSGRLSQTVNNLVNNAVAHTPRGGTIIVTSSCDGNWSAIAVSDTGDGLAPDQLEVIFERFTRYREGAGIGIGLNIARSIVHAHQGTLVAHSDGPGLGATFTMALPAGTSGGSRAS